MKDTAANKNIYKTLTLFTLFTSSVFSFEINNLSLKEAEKIALHNNKTMRIAEEDTKSAKHRKDQAISKFFPHINYYALYQKNTQEEVFFDVYDLHLPLKPGFTSYGSAFQLIQPILSTDRIFSFKAKELEQEIYTFKEANTKIELLKAVRDSYYSVMLYEKALEIQRENIDYLSLALKKEQGSFEAGNSTSFEVNQSKAQVASALSHYYATLKMLKSARNKLILTLGIDPLLETKLNLAEKAVPIHSISDLSKKLDLLAENYNYSDEIITSTFDFTNKIEDLKQNRDLALFSESEVQFYLDLALQQRPDLQARKLQKSLSQQKVNSKLGHYLPKITGYLRYSYNDVYPGTVPWGNQPYHINGGLVLNWNIFDSLLRENELREARSEKSSANLAFEQTLEKIELQVRDALYQLEEAMFSYLSANQAVKVAEQAAEQAKERLSFGKITALEYRDAVNHLAQTKNLLNKTSFELIDAYYQIRYTTAIDTR